VVSGLANAAKLLARVRDGAEQYELIEVMACPGGCVMGGGQPADTYLSLARRDVRSRGLYDTDGIAEIRASQENAEMDRFWDSFIRGHEHELLHRNLRDNS